LLPGVIISFGVAGVWFVLFLVSFLRDQRLLRNGVYLVLTLLFAGLGVVFALEKVSESAAKVLVVAVLVCIPLSIAVLAVFLIANGGVMRLRALQVQPEGRLHRRARRRTPRQPGATVAGQPTGSRPRRV
jgi:hypothetical protein